MRALECKQVQSHAGDYEEEPVCPHYQRKHDGVPEDHKCLLHLW